MNHYIYEILVWMIESDSAFCLASNKKPIVNRCTA